MTFFKCCDLNRGIIRELSFIKALRPEASTSIGALSRKGFTWEGKFKDEAAWMATGRKTQWPCVVTLFYFFPFHSKCTYRHKGNQTPKNISLQLWFFFKSSARSSGAAVILRGERRRRAATLKGGGKQEASLLLRGKIRPVFAAAVYCKLQSAPQPRRMWAWLWKGSTTWTMCAFVGAQRATMLLVGDGLDAERWSQAAGGRTFLSDHRLVAKRQSLMLKEGGKKTEISTFRNQTRHKYGQAVVTTATACCFISEEGLFHCKWQRMTAMT